MRKVPNLLLIGAAERNIGKTEFACSLIKKLKADFTVIGIKITAVKENDGKCPRGGNGCGVCSSLKTNFCITEETDTILNKDTSKMLNAGAAKVYWLRVLKEHLYSGIEALFSKIEKENCGKLCLICESNSARLAVQPGLFIVIKKDNSDCIKESCRNVINLADVIVKFNPEKICHDLSDENIEFDGVNWSVSKNE